jgi:small subunit ribosomal protein S16
LLRIRLARTGAKKQSSYRIVVIDRERARDGKFVEILGHYNPRRHPPELVVNRERVDYWLGRGAQPSETVRSFLKRAASA